MTNKLLLIIGVMTILLGATISFGIFGAPFSVVNNGAFQAAPIGTAPCQRLPAYVQKSSAGDLLGAPDRWSVGSSLTNGKTAISYCTRQSNNGDLLFGYQFGGDTFCTEYNQVDNQILSGIGFSCQIYTPPVQNATPSPPSSSPPPATGGATNPPMRAGIPYFGLIIMGIGAAVTAVGYFRRK